MVRGGLRRVCTALLWCAPRRRAPGSRPSAAITVVLLLGCGPVAVPDDAGTTGATGDSAPTSTGHSSATPTSTGDTGHEQTTAIEVPVATTTTEGPSTGSSTDDPPDLPGTEDIPPPTCDIFTQDCPPGHKCTPYSEEWGFLNTTRCVPVTEDPAAPGEPCSFDEGPYLGLDDCDVGAFCWDGDGEDVFTCAPLCAGSYEQPICPADHFCAIFGEGLAICDTASCDPIAQDCLNPDELCIPNAYWWEDWCLPDDSEVDGQIHEPCSGETECAKGLYCIVSEYAAVECDPFAWGCCEPFCEIGVDVCPGVGQECTQVFDFDYPGVCQLPF